MADNARDIGIEARRLLDSVQEWAQEWAQRSMPAPPSGHPGPECQWCPLCQAASVLRGEHPELTERLAEAGTVVLGALRSIVDAAGSHGDAARDGAAGGGAADAGERVEARPVQRIHLDEPGGPA